MTSRDKENLYAVWIIFVVLMFCFLIGWGISNFPTCKTDEVYVRGVFGYVCVKGHQ